MYDELIEELRLESQNMHYGKDDCELFAKSADAIEDLQGKTKVLEKIADKWCDAVPKWIPITERLPEHSGDYFVYSVGGNWKQLSAVEIGFWDDKRFIVQSFFAVTHWMPLPQPPESEGE